MLIINNRNNFARNRGLSLIELMVSISLGIILSSGIVAVYLESKRNYAAEEELSRIQENGRFALSLLKRELSMAGFFGGYFVADDLAAVSVTNDCATNWALDVVPAIELINNNAGSPYVTTAGTTLTCGLANIKDGTDVFTIKRTAAAPTIFDSVAVNGATFVSDRWYLKVDGYGETKGWYKNSPPTFVPSEAVEFWEVYAKVFYIRDYSTTTGDDIPTLCVISLSPGGMVSTDCLVEGIEDMQIEFGMDITGDSVPNTYIPDPTDLSVAVTARVYLLVRSLGALVATENANTKTYQLGLDSSTLTTAADGHLRQIFSTTVLIRNAILPVTSG
jgi:type IV pilus assembly protein PilW